MRIIIWWGESPETSMEIWKDSCRIVLTSLSASQTHRLTTDFKAWSLYTVQARSSRHLAAKRYWEIQLQCRLHVPTLRKWAWRYLQSTFLGNRTEWSFYLPSSLSASSLRNELVNQGFKIAYRVQVTYLRE